MALLKGAMGVGGKPRSLLDILKRRAKTKKRAAELRNTYNKVVEPHRELLKSFYGPFLEKGEDFLPSALPEMFPFATGMVTPAKPIIEKPDLPGDEWGKIDTGHLRVAYRQSGKVTVGGKGTGVNPWSGVGVKRPLFYVNDPGMGRPSRVWGGAKGSGADIEFTAALTLHNIAEKYGKKAHTMIPLMIIEPFELPVEKDGKVQMQPIDKYREHLINQGMPADETEKLNMLFYVAERPEKRLLNLYGSSPSAKEVVKEWGLEDTPENRLKAVKNIFGRVTELLSMVHKEDYCFTSRGFSGLDLWNLTVKGEVLDLGAFGKNNDRDDRVPMPKLDFKKLASGVKQFSEWMGVDHKKVFSHINKIYKKLNPDFNGFENHIRPRYLQYFDIYRQERGSFNPDSEGLQNLGIDPNTLLNLNPDTGLTDVNKADFKRIRLTVAGEPPKPSESYVEDDGRSYPAIKAEEYLELPLKIKRKLNKSAYHALRGKFKLYRYGRKSAVKKLQGKKADKWVKDSKTTNNGIEVHESGDFVHLLRYARKKVGLRKAHEFIENPLVKILRSGDQEARFTLGDKLVVNIYGSPDNIKEAFKSHARKRAKELGVKLKFIV